MSYFDVVIAILCMSASGICSLFLGSLSGLTLIHIDALSVAHPNTARRLRRLRGNNTEGAYALFIFDITFVSAAAVAAFAWVGNLSGTWAASTATLFVFVILMLILKALFHALGERYAERLALLSGRFVGIAAFAASPMNAALNYIHQTIAAPVSEESSREEFDALVDTARDEGALDDDEYRILKNIMNFSEVYAADVMTPRTVVFSCSVNAAVEEVAAMPELQMYSRFPVWEGNSFDSVVGYVLARDVLRAALSGKKHKTMRDIMREVYFVPENAPLGKALEQFLKRRQHLFVVVDEYGGVEGLLTMEDVMEAILGAEIVDEADRIIDLRELAKSRRDRRIATFQRYDSDEENSTEF